MGSFSGNKFSPLRFIVVLEVISTYNWSVVSFMHILIACIALQVNLESLANWEEKQMFKECVDTLFIDDMNLIFSKQVLFCPN